MGDPDQPHSYSYTPDVATGLVTLGARAERHRIGVAPARGRHPHHATARRPHLRPGRPPAPRASPPDAPRSGSSGLFQPALREYLHTLYQFTDRWVVDDTKFRTAFGNLATPLDDALATTFSWYRSAARPTGRDDQLVAGLARPPAGPTARHAPHPSDPHPPPRRKDPSWTSRPPAEPPPRHGRGRRPRHRRLHRTRIDLRLPEHPEVRHRRDPGQLTALTRPLSSPGSSCSW